MEQAKMKFWKMLFLGSIGFLIFTARTVLVHANVEKVAAPFKTVWINSMKIDVKKFGGYSRAVTPPIRQTGNRLSGRAGTA